MFNLRVSLPFFVYIIHYKSFTINWQYARILEYKFVEYVHLTSCTLCVTMCTMGKEAFVMPLLYKINVLQSLKEKGYTTYKLRTEKLLSESTIQRLRKNKGVAWENLETLCCLLDCQPGDLIKYVPDEDNFF